MFSLKQLWDAYQEADFSSQDGSYAAINPDDGRIVVVPSEFAFGLDEIEDVESQLSEGNWLELPTKNDLELGRPLVFQFAEQYLYGADYDRAERYFSRRGAYRKWKDLLIARDLEKKWYQFEEKATIEALKEWLTENDVTFIDDVTLSSDNEES